MHQESSPALDSVTAFSVLNWASGLGIGAGGPLRAVSPVRRGAQLPNGSTEHGRAQNSQPRGATVQVGKLRVPYPIMKRILMHTFAL